MTCKWFTSWFMATKDIYNTFWKPQPSTNLQIASAVNGVFSEVFITTVHPVANAGPIQAQHQDREIQGII